MASAAYHSHICIYASGRCCCMATERPEAWSAKTTLGGKTSSIHACIFKLLKNSLNSAWHSAEYEKATGKVLFTLKMSAATIRGIFRLFILKVISIISKWPAQYRCANYSCIKCANHTYFSCLLMFLLSAFTLISLQVRYMKSFFSKIISIAWILILSLLSAREYLSRL